MKNNYKLHARNADAPLALVDLCFSKSAYGDFDYRVLYEDGIYSIYLSDKGFKQAEKFGQKLANKNYYKKIIGKMDLLISNLKEQKKDSGRKGFSDKNPKEQWKAVRNIIINFSELYRYCEQPMLAFFENILLNKKIIKSDLNKLFKNKKLAKEYKLSEKEKYALDILATLGEKKFEIHKNLPIVYEIIEMLNKKLRQDFRLSNKQVMMLQTGEFEKAILGIKPNKKKFNDRLKGFVLIPARNNNFFNCYTGSKFKAWKNKLTSQGKKISGRVAYPGKAIGLAKIHISTLKGQKIPRGSILVSGMTNPQIVPFLKNAAAIITDEGGLMCHAAIVSRELKIPCIVGTGNATQILKDGDKVEVDAIKGIVRILKVNKLK